MYKIFVLEDDPTRLSYLNGRFYDYQVDFANSCNQVERFNPPYSLILLDHDLGGRQLERHPDNGLTFLRLIKAGINPEATLVYHSFNPEGAKAMKAEMDGYGYVAPFRSPLFSAIINDALLGRMK